MTAPSTRSSSRRGGPGARAQPLEASGPPALGPTPAEVGEPAQLVAVPLVLPPLVHEAVAAPEAPGQQEPGRGAAA